MSRTQQNIGSKIKEIRLSLGESMEEFGKRFNTSKGTVNNWEKDRNFPNKANLKIIADIAGISVNKLLGIDELKLSFVKATIIASEGEKFNSTLFNNIQFFLESLSDLDSFDRKNCVIPLYYYCKVNSFEDVNSEILIQFLDKKIEEISNITTTPSINRDTYTDEDYKMLAILQGGFFQILDYLIKT